MRHLNATAMWMHLCSLGIEVPMVIASVLARWVADGQCHFIDKDGRSWVAPIAEDCVPVCGTALGDRLVADDVEELMRRWVRWALREKYKRIEDLSGELRAWLEKGP